MPLILYLITTSWSDLAALVEYVELFCQQSITFLSLLVNFTEIILNREIILQFTSTHASCS